MRYKLIFLSVLGVLILVTIVLQMTTMGNYEEMVETEYDEFQIRIDFKRMAQEIYALFKGKPYIRAVKTEAESEEDKAIDGQEGPANTISPLQEVPRAPTLNTLPPTAKER